MAIVKGEFAHLLFDSIFPLKRDKCGMVRHWFARLRLCSHIIEEVSYEEYIQELAEEWDEILEAAKRPIFKVEKRD